MFCGIPAMQRLKGVGMEILTDFPKIQCPFIRQTYPVNKDHFKQSSWLAGGVPHFFSYYSAMRLHGMTSHQLIDVYVTCVARKTGRTISGISYHFIYCRKKHFWGNAQQWVTKQDSVNVSDLERTVLDGLDRPDLCGGLTEVARGMWNKQKEIDPQKLVSYAKMFRTRAAVKRLGYVLEALELFPDIIPPLGQSIAAAKVF